MSKSDQLKKIFPEFLRGLADELDRDPSLMDQLIPSRHEGPRKVIGKKPSTDIDPFEVLRTGGEAALRGRLELLDVSSLKAIISRHGLDTTRLAQKWHDKQRLASFIVERITARAQKGQVFMAS